MHLDKRDFPLVDIRRHLETGPIVLVTSEQEGRSNIMTMGWHSMLQFTPALVGCYTWEGNRSHAMIRASRECVINVPTIDLADKVVAIGNSHGDDGDKFAATGLTPVPARSVRAPLIAECYASFECRPFDDRMIDEYSFFIWEVVAAHVADIAAPRTLHYRGQGEFMVAGEMLDYRARFRSENLWGRRRAGPATAEDEIVRISLRPSNRSVRLGGFASSRIFEKIEDRTPSQTERSSRRPLPFVA